MHTSEHELIEGTVVHVDYMSKDTVNRVICQCLSKMFVLIKGYCFCEQAAKARKGLNIMFTAITTLITILLPL